MGVIIIALDFIFICIFFVQKRAKYLITLQWILQSLVLTLKTILLVSNPLPFYAVSIFPLSMCACPLFFSPFFLFLLLCVLKLSSSMDSILIVKFITMGPWSSNYPVSIWAQLISHKWIWVWVESMDLTCTQPIYVTTC